MTIQLDGDANAVSEAFRAGCALLMDANGVSLCGCVFVCVCGIHLNASVSKTAL